jgi:Ca-activated chloride channel family protein
MVFLYPSFFLFLLPLLVFFIFIFRQKTQTQYLFNQELYDRLLVKKGGLLLKHRYLLYVGAFFFIILALSRPVIQESEVELKSEGIDIMVAIDISHSMLAEDIYPNRLEVAKHKVFKLLEYSENDRIGVMGYAKYPYIISPLTLDHKASSYLIKHLDTHSVTGKGTNINAVLQIMSKKNKKKKEQALLILTDGGDKSDFSEDIEYANKHKIKIFILAIASEKGAPIKDDDGQFLKYEDKIYISHLNTKIKQLALNTGGAYMKVRIDSLDIKTLLSEIQKRFRKQAFESKNIHIYEELFIYPLILAIFILLLAFSSVPSRYAWIVLFSVLLPHQNAQAGVLDFLDIKNANDAYSNGNYEKSETIYKKNKTIESKYNLGDTYYKQKKYDKAIQTYEKIKFEENSFKEYERLHNLGNSYALSKNKQGLEKAVEQYKKALEIIPNKETKENLEKVKKLIEKQKENTDNKDNKDNKDSEDKKDNKDNKDSEDKKDPEDKKDSKEESKDKKQSEENKKSNKEKEKEEKKQQEKQKNNKEKDDKNKNSENIKQETMKEQIMSNKEEKKWMQYLQDNQPKTKLYRLKIDKNEKDSNEKPW